MPTSPYSAGLTRLVHGPRTLDPWYGSSNPAPTSGPVSTAPPASSTLTTEAPVTVAVLPVIDPSDPEPMVTFGIRPYGETAYFSPDDLQQFYLYPDGEVIEPAPSELRLSRGFRHPTC